MTNNLIDMIFDDSFYDYNNNDQQFNRYDFR